MSDEQAAQAAEQLAFETLMRACGRVVGAELQADTKERFETIIDSVFDATTVERLQGDCLYTIEAVATLCSVLQDNQRKAV